MVYIIIIIIIIKNVGTYYYLKNEK